MAVIIQVPSVILPNVPIITGAETETVNDLVTHVSIEMDLSGAFAFLRDKTIHIVATEIVVAGVPGTLQSWVEVSPYPSSVSAAYWAAIGGGGGVLPPGAPTVEAALGVNLTVHTLMLAWQIHSPYARLVVQTPVSATPLTSFWLIQAMISGKG
ncbi:MAG: hypothetical protein Q8O55_07565 [Dehalococcoidales bacterium]|nr:hypothetical protein [Dehalococcoidales bacterium]